MSLPDGWPRLTMSVFYDDAAAAIDWLCRAFGFEVRLKVEHEGRIQHSELTYEGAVIMVGQTGGRPWCLSPRTAGGCTQAVCLQVDDVDAHCERARAAGAVIDAEPADHDHGPEYWTDRTYGAVDPEGHHWWFSMRVR